MATIKVIEIIGASPSGWEDAAKNALAEAAKTVQNIKGVDVTGWTAKVENNKIAEYHTSVKIAFTVDANID